MPTPCRGGGKSESLRTAEQSLSTSHQFSRAPGISGDFGSFWESVAVEIGEVNGQKRYYYAGFFTDNSDLDFGCGTMSNPDGSLNDTFVVAFDASGNCQWQRHFKSDESDSAFFTTYSYVATDLTVTSDGHPVLSYKQFVYPYFQGGDPFRTSRVVELSTSGSTLWSTVVGSSTSNEYQEIEAIEAAGGGLVATGTYNASFNFAGSTLNYPSNSGDEAMVLRWNDLSNGSRSEDWARGFGGNDDNIPEDVSVHGNSGDIAVVGNFFGTHTDLDGTTTTATNSSFFVQTLDSSGNHLDAYASAPNPSQSDDTERLKSVDFNSSGELFLAGDFHGDLDPSDIFVKQDPVITSSISDDVDFFAARFSGPNGLSKNNNGWFVQSGYYNPGGNVYPNRKATTNEQLTEISAGNNYVAITGSVCDQSTECVEDGFAHVYDFVNNTDPSTPLYASLTETYENSSHAFFGRAIDHRSNEFVVGGLNTEYSYSFPGGSTLPGGYDFIVSYTF